MSRSQRRTRAVLTLKILNVITGTLNAMLSIGLAYITILIILLFKAFGVPLLSSLILIFVFILSMCILKLCFDFIFIYGVVKERLMIVKLYCYLSVVLFILMTLLLMIIGTKTSDIYIWIIVYSLNISTILLSHFYKQICDTEDDTTHNV